MKIPPIVLLAALSAVQSSPVAADFFGETFGDVTEARGACFMRAYDAAHLARHARQKVIFVALEMMSVNADGRSNSAADFQLGLGVEVKGGRERYLGQAYCKASADGADCFLEGDGGRMAIRPAGERRLRVEVGSYGLSFEGSDFLQIGAEESDDNVFILDRTAENGCAEKHGG